MRLHCGICSLGVMDRTPPPLVQLHLHMVPSMGAKRLVFPPAAVVWTVVSLATGCTSKTSSTLSSKA